MLVDNLRTPTFKQISLHVGEYDMDKKIENRSPANGF